MGLTELRLAQPEPLLLEEIYVRSIHARDVWENARIFGSLGEAAADCSIVVGTTRRRGHRRKNISMTPHDLAAWLAQQSGTAAIVFGNERTGLEDAELDICNFASHIPVSESFPSLNLSHAVQLYSYELFLAMEEQRPVKGEWTAMNQEAVSALTDSITDILAGIGFYKKTSREQQSRFLRDLIARAGLSDSEGKYFKHIIKKAASLKTAKGNKIHE